jgi:AraC-like DNA-binding protein
MPLYMDFHQLAGVTVEDVKKAHMADIAVQEKFGVKYLQFWVNKEAGTVFCLTEGPDKETCQKVHQMAHGNIACAMTEVEPGFYEALMGKAPLREDHLARHADGTVDVGYRSVMALSVREQKPTKSHVDHPLFALPISNIAHYDGREVKLDTDDSFVSVFTDTNAAIDCALEIHDDLLKTHKKGPKVVFKIGISADQPVTQEGEFFGNAIRLAQRLSGAAFDNKILISSLAARLYESGRSKKSPKVQPIGNGDELFINNLFDLAERNLSSNGFNVEYVCKNIGVSRPQLYRKITSITGRNPNNFLRDLRLEKALTLLRRKSGSVAQIAEEVGYNSPSYFSKVFAEKFGCSPSELG